MKSIKLFFYCYFSVLIILFVLGFFFDLQISQNFAVLEGGEYYSQNVFAVGVEIFGELPFYILISFCFVVFCVFAKNITNKAIKIFVQSWLLLCANGVLFFGFLRTIKFAKSYIAISIDALTFIALGVIAFLFTIVIIVLVNKLKPKNLKNLFLFSIMIVVVSIVAVFVVQIIKNNVCFRPRFRTINFVEKKDLFRSWGNMFGEIKINNLLLPDDACKSFPSGHTMTAAIFLGFVFLSTFFNIKNNTKHLCWILPSLFLLTVGVLRIVGGAHFLTDVVFSAILVGVLYVLVFLSLRKRIIA